MINKGSESPEIGRIASENTSELGSKSSDAWFSATELANMQLPGMPRSDRRMRDVVEREQWPFRDVPSKGGKRGLKREYCPPPGVMALIREAQQGAPQTAHTYPTKPGGLNGDKPLQRQPAVYSPDDYVALPLYDVRAAAGGGVVPDSEHVVDFLHFKKAWLRTELRCSPDALYLIYVDGESMEPALSRGDVILVNSRDQSQGDGVYVLRMDGALLVKRLQRKPGGIIRVTSDNPAYEPFEVKAQEMEVNDFAIIGRVVWAGRRM